jgi:hypothetical protein
MDGETDAGGGNQEACRAPRKEDLRQICAELNRLRAKYIVVGGLAVIQAGYLRFTADIDILIDPQIDNEAAVFEALRVLPDKAVDQLSPGDVGKFTVVRVADEVLVDIMASACGVDYATAIQDAYYAEVDGVRVPFASPAALLKMKQTHREKDIPDVLFLRKMMAEGEALKTTKEKKSFWDSFWRKSQS